MSLYSFQNRFVTAIDILHENGKLLNKCDEENFKEVYNVIKKEIEVLKESIEFEEIHIGEFKNLLVISNIAENIESLKEIIYFLGRVQINLLLKGILIRGAITIGECYYIEQFFTGSAIEEAYSLTVEKAITPRIILSEKIKECLNEYNEYDIEQLQYEVEDFTAKKDENAIEYLNEEIKLYNIEENVKSSLRLDKDGILYIDYIKECIEEYLTYEQEDKKSEFDESLVHYALGLHEYYFDSVINKIKILILNGINDNNDMEFVLKYSWLKDYYNKTLLNLGGSNKNRAYIIN